MNSRDALEFLEREVVNGRIKRLEGSNKTSHGILYQTTGGIPFGLNIDGCTGAWRSAPNGIAYLHFGEDAKFAKETQIVLQEDRLSSSEWDDVASISGVSLRTAPLKSTSFDHKNAGLKDNQKVFYVNNIDALEELISFYARSREKSLTILKNRFLNAFPDFESSGAFGAITGTFYDTYRQRVDALLLATARHPGDGWAVLQDVLAASQGGRGALPPFFDGDVSWRVRRARDVDPARFDAALDALIATQDDPVAAAVMFNETFGPALEAIGEANTFRDTRVVPSTVLAAIAPDRAISVRYQLYVNAERLLNDRMLFANKPMSATEYSAVLALAEQVRSAMIDWGWGPRDLWDVHGFILATCGKKENEMDDAALLQRFTSQHFDAFRERWSAEQIAAFCKIARVAHDAGLDWYHTNMTHNPVRLGRKPHVDRRAVAAFGYLNLPGAPRLLLNDARGIPAIGDQAFPLSAAGAEAFAEAVSQHASRISNWQPLDPIRPGRWPDEAGFGDDEGGVPKGSETVVSDPTNLILYGPPGTGKTYATAAHAVRLCDGLADDDPLLGEGRRDALMARYRKLARDERIEFVTFHQSMAYEDFVEGLRPSSIDEEGQPLGAGFRLTPRPGVFRQIARRAEMSTGAGSEAFTLDDRQVFKMSIGDASKPEWAWVFDEAIAEGYAYLGFGDIDWSNDRFADRAAILAAVNDHDGPRGSFNEETEPSLQAGPVKSPDLFRNELQVGDVIVVAKGLSLFRAIGVVEGNYEYAPREDREDGEYSHRRRVRWLWHDDDGVPVSEINAKRFGIETIYRLKRENLNVPALERYANSQRIAGAGTPASYVLIVDEINRANISKVFGELITLLETDKRLGKRNELKVRLPYSGDDFGVPANLHIIGTMNTADRSIALIDKALRRRFTFTEMMPDYDVPGMEAAIGGVTLAAILRAINDRIEYLLDREHQIGHGWLLGCDSKASLDAAMREKVIPLIAEYFFEDWGRTADVLGGRDDNAFLEAERLPPPPGLSDAEPRTRWVVRNAFGADAYSRLIG